MKKSKIMENAATLRTATKNVGLLWRHVELTKQEISDLTLACETLMEQLYDNQFSTSERRISPSEEEIDEKEKYYRLWDLSEKLNKQ